MGGFTTHGWGEIGPELGEITTQRGWFYDPRVGEVGPELGGITTRLWWNYDLRVG